MQIASILETVENMNIIDMHWECGDIQDMQDIQDYNRLSSSFRVLSWQFLNWHCPVGSIHGSVVQLIKYG